MEALDHLSGASTKPSHELYTGECQEYQALNTSANFNINSVLLRQFNFILIVLI